MLDSLEFHFTSPFQLQRQRAELQKMRSLLFHAELKVKRHSKIKSKKFHRIRNRERERQKGGDVDGENMDDAERMELERQRAEERMSMRHGKGSTWAKSLAGVNAGQDDEVSSGGDNIVLLLISIHLSQTRQAILARLDTQERLRRKIKGTDSNDDGDDDREETEQGTTNASREETASTANAPLSGLLAMKFMRNRNGTAEVVETGFGDSDDDAANAAVGTNSGRMSFGNASSLPASNRGSPPAAKNRASGAPTLDESRFTSAKAVPLIGGAGVPAQEKVAALGSSATGSSAADLTSAHRPVEDFAAQRHLIEMAFALDDVVDKTFEAEKEKTIEQGLPSAGANASGAMPGWGHWAGAGIAPRSTKSPNADAERTAQLRSAAAKRKDARLKHVIISEQRDKKFSNKYNADQVPFPYKSKEQYEAMMRNPLGKEWNAVASHQRLTKPRVITKIGTVIDPLTFTKQPKDGQSSNY